MGGFSHILGADGIGQVESIFNAAQNKQAGRLRLRPWGASQASLEPLHFLEEFALWERDEASTQGLMGGSTGAGGGVGSRPAVAEAG